MQNPTFVSPYEPQLLLHMTKKILVIGAGRSTSALINYLLKESEKNDWFVTVVDQDADLAHSKVKDHPRGTSGFLDINDAFTRINMIRDSDIVISMLPAHMHMEVARDCVENRKHMVTASYISDEMKALDERAQEAGVILMNEIGVDPGIDHLSAKKVLDEIQSKGGKMLIFESFTGGLVAPESDNNPWNYKFTWNPRNVVLAGSGGAVKFIQCGKYKYIPHHQLFRRTEVIDIEGWGRFEGYANRDSLRYRSIYGLDEIPTIYRGTLRRPGFCRAWDVFVKLGMTDDSYILDDSENMTHRDLINTFLAYSPVDTVELKLMHYLNIPQDDPVMEKLQWLGIFDNEKLGLKKATPAQALQHILMKKWNLEPNDKDMVVMWHKFGFELNGEKRMIEASMVKIGNNARDTAMAQTVGLPVGMATKLILNGTIHTPGVHIPIQKEVYEPMLEELKSHGIVFSEVEVPYQGY